MPFDKLKARFTPRMKRTLSRALNCALSRASNCALSLSKGAPTRGGSQRPDINDLEQDTVRRLEHHLVVGALRVAGKLRAMARGFKERRHAPCRQESDGLVHIRN